MKLVKFILALAAGFGLVKIIDYVTEIEMNEEEELDIYDDEYPLFV